MSQIKTRGLTLKILVSMACGLVAGLLLNWLLSLSPTRGFRHTALLAANAVGSRSENSLTSIVAAGVAASHKPAGSENDPVDVLPWLLHAYLIDGLFHVIGQIFIASLKVLVVPLVFVSLVCGVAALDDIGKLGRIGGKTLFLYIATTALAVSLALCFAVLVKPGQGFNLQSAADFKVKEPPSLAETIIAIFPTNPIESMARGEMLQIIVFAILVGLALSLSGESGQRLVRIFNDLNEAIMVLLMMLFAPFGVFCLVARVFAEQGIAAIMPLASYFLLVLFVLLLHGSVVYGALLLILGRLNPIRFFAKIRGVLVFAFSTASSNATLPVTLETTEHKLGVNNAIASFTIPLGATVNMDGTAIMQGVATAFIAQAYGIEIGIAGYLMVVLTATLASIGTAGVPGVGLITLAMVLRQVNLPVEGIALIIGVDRLLDMVRTAVNVTGDIVVTCIVARSEGQLSLDTYMARDEQAPAPVSPDTSPE